MFHCDRNPATLALRWACRMFHKVSTSDVFMPYSKAGQDSFFNYVCSAIFLHHILLSFLPSQSRDSQVSCHLAFTAVLTVLLMSVWGIGLVEVKRLTLTAASFCRVQFFHCQRYLHVLAPYRNLFIAFSVLLFQSWH